MLPLTINDGEEVGQIVEGIRRSIRGTMEMTYHAMIRCQASATLFNETVLGPLRAPRGAHEPVHKYNLNMHLVGYLSCLEGHKTVRVVVQLLLKSAIA